MISWWFCSFGYVCGYFTFVGSPGKRFFVSPGKSWNLVIFRPGKPFYVLCGNSAISHILSLVVAIAYLSFKRCFY